jgi:hypothetical protein
MKDNIVKALKLGVVPIKFRKIDGTIRNMKATLADDLISTKTYSKSSGPEHVQCVWDVDKGAWRSFRWDSLLSPEYFEK